MTVMVLGIVTALVCMNRKAKEQAVALGLVVFGLFLVFYGFYNYYLYVTLEFMINFAWFLLFLCAGIPLAALGVVYTVISYSYFDRIKKINRSLK